LGCRFGRSGSSKFVVGFLHLRWSSCLPAPAVRNCRDRIISNNSSEGDRSEAVRRLRVRQFDRGRMKDRNCVRAFRTHYVGIGGFMQATACCHIAEGQ